MQSDIYAAGVVLFEALTGRLPWPATELSDLLAAKCGPPPDLRICLAGLPVGWVRLIGRCLSKDPTARPADGQALLMQLHEIGEEADNIVDLSGIHTGMKGVGLTAQPRRIGDTLPLLHGPRLRDQAAVPVNRPRSRPVGAMTPEPEPITLVRAARGAAAPPVIAMHAVQRAAQRLPGPYLDITPREPAKVQPWRVGVAPVGMPAPRVARGLVDADLVDLCCQALSPQEISAHAACVLVPRQGVADRLRASAWARIPGRRGQVFTGIGAGTFRATCTLDRVAAPATV